MLIMRRSEQRGFCVAHNSALCSFADHRLWLGRQHRTFTEAENNGGRERPAPCGGAAGWASAEPASGPAQAATKGDPLEQWHRAGCVVYGASGGGETWHSIARCGAASPWPRCLGRRAQWRRAGGNEGDCIQTKPRSQSAGACGGSLAGSNLARPSPARHLPRSMQAA